MPLFHSARDGSVRLGSARFTYPQQFSTALEWEGLFTCHYWWAASTAVTPERLFNSVSLHRALAGSAPWLLTRGTSVLPKQTTKQPFLVVYKKVRSFKTVAFEPLILADLNLVGLLCLVCQVCTQ